MEREGGRRPGTGRSLAFLSSMAGGGGLIETHAPDGSVTSQLGSLSQAFPEDGKLTLYKRGQKRVEAASWGDVGTVLTYGEQGQPVVRLTARLANVNHGVVAAADAGEDRALLLVADGGAGEVETKGPNRTINVRLTHVPGDANRGKVQVADEQGRERAFMAVDETGSGAVAVVNAADVPRAGMNGSGVIVTFSPHGHPTASLGNVEEAEDRGLVSVSDVAGIERAALSVDSTGQGVVDVRNTAGKTTAELSVTGARAGFIQTYGPNGNPNVRLRHCPREQSQPRLRVGAGRQRQLTRRALRR